MSFSRPELVQRKVGETGAAIGARAGDGSCKQQFKLNYVVARLQGTAKL